MYVTMTGSYVHNNNRLYFISCMYCTEKKKENKKRNNQGYQSHQGCQIYLAGDTRGKWMNQREVSIAYM